MAAAASKTASATAPPPTATATAPATTTATATATASTNSTAATATASGAAAAATATTATTATAAGELVINVEFSGGLELLFGKVKNHKVRLPAQTIDLKKFLLHMRDNMLKERPELFMSNDTVRPGILVLINDTDWELEGGLSYSLQSNDTLVFISTLHGG